MKKINHPQREPVALRSILSMIFVLSVVTAVSFSSGLDNEFINWDDDYYVTRNYSIFKLDLDHIKEMFTSLYTRTYCPVTVFTFALEYKFFGLKPFYYLLNNLILHMGVVFLALRFALQLGLNQRAAFLAALFFAIHPMHVESVTWITERKDVLYSFFYMLALTTYWKYLENGKWTTYAFTFLWGLLSILSKAMALSLPLVFLVCDWFYGRKVTKKVLIEKIPHFLYIIPIAALTFLAHVRTPGQNFIQGLIFWVWSFSFYLQKFFWPVEFVPIYTVPKPVSFARLEYNIAVIVFFIFVYLVVRFRSLRWLRFSIFYYFFSIFFLIRMEAETHVSTVADRFMYLPSLGFCLLLGYVFDLYFKKYAPNALRRRVFTALLIGLIMVLSVKTYIQCDIWQNSVTFWDEIIKKAPNSTAYNNRGQMYLGAKDYDKAMAYFNKSLKLLSNQSPAYYNRGLIYLDRKEYDKAIKEFDKALKYNDKYEPAYHNKSFVYIQLKKYDLAAKCATQGILANPRVGGLYANRAIASKELGDYEHALNDALKAKELGHDIKAGFLEDLKKKVAAQKAPGGKK